MDELDIGLAENGLAGGAVVAVEDDDFFEGDSKTEILLLDYHYFNSDSY